ncbi:c-type cytochrome [Psychrobacter sp. AOP7-D1-15]|jgi:mono/diheme cytochrome c family protein|uniref:c-type cytochrome n=1 Tax=Psychrobacter TaxID=497 RepID=UPI000401C66F|nr:MULTISPECIES: cytochrome c [Psychrobacter]MCD1280529.1 cytochrome c [Psychrobacter sp. CCUG 69069]MDN5621221.1 cytochrome c [Psychrobacter sp.]HCN18289.1 cytochrome c [Psychrobacter sp.]
MKFLLGVLFTVVVAIVGVFTVVMSGVINIGADQGHSPLVYNFLETARTRSIAYASKDIIVPDLEKVEMISSGGADYKDMCAGCHLSPGVESTDFSESLYPKPPNFTNAQVVDRYKTDAGAQQSFWAIKHGIMASGMPAWGASHDDDRMWAMVAFIRSLPELNENQYTMLTTRLDDDMMDMSLNSDMMDMSEGGAGMQH